MREMIEKVDDIQDGNDAEGIDIAIGSFRVSDLKKGMKTLSVNGGENQLNFFLVINCPEHINGEDV